MPLGTLDRSPPPFFKQGPSALSKLFFFSALALFLMVADSRLTLVKPVRAVIMTLLFPAQWLVMQPVRGAGTLGDYLTSLEAAQADKHAAQLRLAAQSERAAQVEELTLENQRLRSLLDLRNRLDLQGAAAQVLYDAADPYTRKVIIDKGMTHGVVAGSPVIDESGVLGQVTRVHPLVSEVTLLTDRDQAIPVLNTRTGVRSVAYGQPGLGGTELELRFMAGNADVQTGDVLSTSGIDGIYPAGLPVAKVTSVERRAESAFARVLCTPNAQIHSALHVLVLPPASTHLPPAPEDPPAAPQRKNKSASRKH
ncbi:MAG: rod shape-determining protein MreC [Burkholderiales bacterium]|nr:rod shape-determining protein MreC [Burkholderiales bacterium]